jgi:rubrerythrin
MSTSENLQAAFAGESQANRKYLAFAMKAERDGFPQVARLFRAAAEAETIHAHAHLRAMKGIGETSENLKAAIEGEAYEFKTMYPEFLATAQTEAHKPAEVSFRNALAVEEIHHSLYSQALEAVQAGADLDPVAIFVCPVCGNTVVGAIPDKCDVCGISGEKFFEVK